MGTRSRIGIQNANGTINSIYCHWDGYPEHHGPILLEHYKDESKVRKLIDLGDISSLREQVEPPFGAHHSYEKPLDDVTVAYHRDRGEPKSEAALSKNEAELLELSKGCNGEFTYLFKDGFWHIADDGKFRVMTPELCEPL